MSAGGLKSVMKCDNTNCELKSRAQCDNTNCELKSQAQCDNTNCELKSIAPDGFDDAILLIIERSRKHLFNDDRRAALGTCEVK